MHGLLYVSFMTLPNKIRTRKCEKMCPLQS